MQTTHKTIDEFVDMFLESAFGEIDIILDVPIANWEDDENSVMREMHESACNCLQVVEWLQDYQGMIEYREKQANKSSWFPFIGRKNQYQG